MAKDLLTIGKKRLDEIPRVKYDYEYLDDSDLEDEESEDADPPVDKVSDEISDLASNISAFDLLDSPQSTICAVAELSEESAPPSVVTESTTAAEAGSPATLTLTREVIYVPFGATRT